MPSLPLILALSRYLPGFSPRAERRKLPTPARIAFTVGLLAVTRGLWRDDHKTLSAMLAPHLESAGHGLQLIIA